MKKSHALRSRRRGQKLTAPESLRPPIGSALAIENVPINDLRRYQNNPRLHPRSQIDKLARAIDEFGFLIPVLIDSQNRVLAGHARLGFEGTHGSPRRKTAMSKCKPSAELRQLL
jgi:hypothetical protein